MDFNRLPAASAPRVRVSAAPIEARRGVTRIEFAE